MKITAHIEYKLTKKIKPNLVQVLINIETKETTHTRAVNKLNQIQTDICQHLKSLQIPESALTCTHDHSEIDDYSKTKKASCQRKLSLRILDPSDQIIRLIIDNLATNSQALTYSLNWQLSGIENHMTALQRDATAFLIKKAATILPAQNLQIKKLSFNDSYYTTTDETLEDNVSVFRERSIYDSLLTTKSTAIAPDYIDLTTTASGIFQTENNAP